jgi:hypothetical protein
VKVKEMFSFQQGLSGETVRIIADSCRRLKVKEMLSFQQALESKRDVIFSTGIK